MIFLILFAVDANSGRDVILVTLGGAILAGVGKLLEFLWNWITQNRADKKEEVGKLEGHLEKRIERLEAENARQAKKNEDDNNGCERKIRKLNKRIRALESSKMQMAAYIKNNCKNPNAPPYEEVPLPPDESEEDTGKETDTHVSLPEQKEK